MTGALTVWLERRLLARIQSRLGPNRWGPFGLFTPIADIIKMIGKGSFARVIKFYFYQPIIEIFQTIQITSFLI